MRRQASYKVPSNIQIRSDQSFQRSVDEAYTREKSETDSVFIDSVVAKEFLFLFEAQEKKRYKTTLVRFDDLPEHQELKIMHKFSYSNKLKQELSSLTYFQHEKLKIPKSLLSLLNSKYKCPLLDTNDLMNRMYGAFFGFIIGDSIGSYLAFHIHKIDELVLKSLMMGGGGTYNINPGQGTDDTELAFSLAYGLIQSGNDYKPDVIAKHYSLWLKSKPFDTSALILIALKQSRGLAIEEESSGESIKGLSQKIKKSAMKNINQESNIGLIRLVPLAIWSIHLSQQEVEILIKREMEQLNPNKLVIQTAILFVKVLHIIFRKGDHQEAFYMASKWIYDNGSPQLLHLWKSVEMHSMIPSKGSLGRLKTSFSYSFIQMNQSKVNFLQTVIEVLRKGGDTDTNAAIVCSMIGAIVGYNQIPSYFRHKIINAEVCSGHQPRPQKYRPGNVVELVDKLFKAAPSKLHIKQ